MQTMLNQRIKSSFHIWYVHGYKMSKKEMYPYRHSLKYLNLKLKKNLKYEQHLSQLVIYKHTTQRKQTLIHSWNVIFKVVLRNS